MVAAKLRNSILGSEAALWYRVRAISWPVESPCACSTRLRLWAPFAGEGQARALAVEFGPPFDQLPDGGRPFLHQGVHRRALAQPVPRRQRILLVQRDFVVVAQRHGDAALRIFGGRFPQAVLGDYQHTARFRQLDGGAQPGHPGSDYQKIRVHSLLR